MNIRPAQIADASAIASLLNVSYRGDTSRAGWTTEADLLDGLRTTPQEITALILGIDSLFLLACEEAKLIGCIHLSKQNNTAHFGMFSIAPTRQNCGLGKQLLLAAENWAQQHWQSHQYKMLVITQRAELIAYYERRGYRRTSTSHPFPRNPVLWTPKVDGLVLEEMEKRLT